MALMTKEQYVESIRKLKPNLYIYGEKVDNLLEHVLTHTMVDSISQLHKFAPDTPLLRAKSNLTQKEINRYVHLHITKEDLIKRVQLKRFMTPQHGCCLGARCVGNDAINAVYATTYDIDQKYKTTYHARFRKWLEMVQEEDLSVGGTMTDSKGDRSKKPFQQENKDAYLRIVEKNDKGIIVRGAKAHQSGAPVDHELLVMPTENMSDEDKDYSVCFATPSYAPGITQIFEAPAPNARRLNSSEIDLGNARYGVHGASLVVFDDVFIPWERVFMCGEYDFTLDLVLRFADLHRLTFAGCKSGHCDLVIGACAVGAEYNGVPKVAHIRDKLVRLRSAADLAYGCAIGSAYLSEISPSGVYFPDSSLVNAAKLQAINAVYLATQVGADIMGGIVCTAPSGKDLDNPKLKGYIDKYFQANPKYSAEDRIRIARLVEFLIGQGSIIPPESMLGGGPPAACELMIRRSIDFGYLMDAAKKIAGIKV